MPDLPTADKFPSLEETHAFLANNARQCIWYCPNYGRLCKCKTCPKDVDKAEKLLASVKRNKLSLDERLQKLEEVAELCCCLRHHQSKIYGSRLTEKVARIWYEELKLAPIPSTEVQPVIAASPRRMFGKHYVHTTESISERLCLNLDSLSDKRGSIYFYTHEATAFTGMIKIGYTCSSIANRLLDWGECGHGDPKLLSSISDVRHPERVELLTHFELIDVWHKIMWCKMHKRTHIEWFKTDIDRAKEIASGWNRWMHEANPYDRRGILKKEWRSRCESLEKLGLAVTAERMLLYHDEDVGKLEKDAASEKENATVRSLEIRVKKEEEGEEEEEEPPLRSVPPRSEIKRWRTVKLQESRTRNAGS